MERDSGKVEQRDTCANDALLMLKTMGQVRAIRCTHRGWVT
uniref:Uncharacterized protein n=1 Tax=Fusarium oxysporum (strain Fo5176) TaxID=660025 RepID=A0A0D2Y3T4_FUSOF